MHLRYKIRNAHTEPYRSDLQFQASELTKEIKTIREEVKLCEGIAVRSESMKEKLKIVQREEQKEKEEKQHEHSR